MKVLIIEDEKAAARSLKTLIEQIAPDFEIIDIIDSVGESIDWFESNKHPELIFMDIHLADGSSFEIFEHVNINSSIIFTTAYDEYALKAFKVNSIDYLLKPISGDDLDIAIKKFKRGAQNNLDNVETLISMLSKERHYASHFLVPIKGDKLFPLSTSSITYFYIEDGNVIAINDLGHRFTINHSLDELTKIIDPNQFFRANRQYIITRGIVKDIDIWFNNRLSINLHANEKHEIIISKQRVSEFKEWFKG